MDVAESLWRPCTLMNHYVKKRSMAKRFSTVGVAIVVLSFLFAIVAYACPEREMMLGAAQRLSTHGGMDNGDPCANGKTDTCQVMRDRMRSVQVSASQATIPHHVLTGAQHPIAMESAAGSKMLHDRGPLSIEYAFHSVFKLRLPLSYLVLRL
jgi:hypothetical protein